MPRPNDIRRKLWAPSSLWMISEVSIPYAERGAGWLIEGFRTSRRPRPRDPCSLCQQGFQVSLQEFRKLWSAGQESGSSDGLPTLRLRFVAAPAVLHFGFRTAEMCLSTPRVSNSDVAKLAYARAGRQPRDRVPVACRPYRRTSGAGSDHRRMGQRRTARREVMS
jgi:hypothetical protein